MPQPALSTGSIDEGRFTAGTLLAGRYRVIERLGRGGMGEVYRANDLKLGQPVALKFLPERMAGNASMLERFHTEVRIARQVSHPNICRVYDIGEADGLAFITMEYVDGEDLASLLRRIGRLSGEKAMEIARRLCAGLAAAHEKGVLHRDLKPANIMIDGSGQVLITDFGLAAIAGKIEGNDIRSGTPAYMAPEQLAGKEVSARSDVYALGLVLYEIFTGKMAFEDGASRAVPASLSSQLKDADPALERVILRCLDPEPANRPSSALGVASALPGGGLLAAALAAGQTPSPELVAAARETGGISIRTLTLCFALVLAGLPAVVVLGSKSSLLEKIPPVSSPEILAQKALQTLEGLGYPDHPADREYAFVNGNFLQYGRAHEKPADFRTQLAGGQPPALVFWYRQSPRPFIPLSYGVVGFVNPPPIESGMVEVTLDPQGRLISLAAVPPQVEDTPASGRAAPRPANWASLFAAAGLEPGRFAAAAPQWVPLAAFDDRAAWIGSYSQSAIPLRVEAASWRGKPVYFQLIAPWTKPDRMPTSNAGLPVLWLLRLIISALIGAAALLARRHMRLGRADTRGASRLAAFLSGCVILGFWFSDGRSVFLGIVLGMFNASLTWILYVALEPYIRRRWPQSLITWSRLLSGAFRDPLVGGHLVIGTALGVALAVISCVLTFFVPYSFKGASLPLSMRKVISGFMLVVMISILLALGGLLLLVVLRVALRRQWLAACAWILGAVAIAAFTGDNRIIDSGWALILYGAMMLILTRFGVLPMVSGSLVLALLMGSPMTIDLSAWYVGGMVFALAAVLALSVYAFHTALAGRPLLKAELLDD